MLHKNEETKCNNTIKKNHKTISYADFTGENKTKRNLTQSYIPGHPFRIIIIGGSVSGKPKALLTLINHKDDNDYDIIDKSYLNKKDSNKAKYQYIFGKHEKNGLEHYKHTKAYIEFLNNIKGVYKNIHKYNSDETQKILIVLDAMITDMISNKTFSPIATELFIMVRKLNISLLLFNHLLDIDFLNLFKIHTVEPYSFLFIGTNPALGTPLRFICNILERK